MRQFQTLWTLQGGLSTASMSKPEHILSTNKIAAPVQSLQRVFSSLSLSGASWPSHFFPPLLSSVAPATTPSPFQAGWVLGLHVDIW